MGPQSLSAGLLLLLLAACASAPPGSVVRVHHIGDISRGCEDPSADGLGLAIADLPAQGIFRISNTSPSAITVYYDAAGSFGDYQMLFVRYRDGDGNLIPIDGAGDCGWWSPKAKHSSLVTEGDWPQRRSLTVPAGGVLDLRRDLSDFVNWMGRLPVPPRGPCQVQVRLHGYLEPRTWRSIGAATEWQPSPCPGTS